MCCTVVANVPDLLKNRCQWVLAYEDSKVPINPCTGQSASSSDCTTWSDYQTARSSCDFGLGDYLGFVFNNSAAQKSDLVGIDIDVGFNADGSVSKEAQQIISACNSYTEVSRSGRGFHILCKGTLPFPGRNNLKGIEIYRDSRYFILTGRVWDDHYEIRNSQNGINKVLEWHFKKEMKPHSKKERNSVIYRLHYKGFENGKLSLVPEYDPVAEGGRHLAMVSLAGQYRSIGMDTKRILKELIKANQLACKPPLKAGELQQIARSVSRYSR